MELPMHSLKPLLIDVCVDLRRRNIGVAQHLLDYAQIRPVPEQVRGETVSEKVWVNVLVQSRALCVFLHNLPDARRRQFRAALGEKDFAATAALDQFRTLR